LRTRSLGALLAAALAAFAAVPATAQACSQWDISRAVIRQSNGYFVIFEFDQAGTLLRGPARALDRRGNPVLRGDVEGTLTRDAIHFTVTWNSFSAGIYDGKVDADGLVFGTSYDKYTPTSTATWNTSRRATCVTPLVG
jgi:hypothetical protein